MALLDKIKTPKDIQKLSLEQLEALAQEIREFMVEIVATTGGHLASSLGAVELTLALHKVFETPQDRIVWDVGHQTYAHKIITGRKEAFSKLRQYKGLAGFPKREESPFDTFNTGHSSTSISAALGMARARDMAGKKNKVIAVIGDGSLSNGLALEALNDAGHKKTDLIIVLNDNTMSISHPVGSLSDYLNQLITGRTYNKIKPQVDRMLESIPAVGKGALKLANYLEETAKGLIVPGVWFEELGLRYFGPVNGHDLPQILETFERLKELSGPILLHVQTKKGKGFEHAEKNPIAFHGTPQFDTNTGESKTCQVQTFSKAFAQSLLTEAKKNKKIVAIVAAMTSGTSLDQFAKDMPERFFDVGIAEGHAVTLAAGMATEGFKPVVTIYSTFLQRAYDMVMHDVCLQNLPVIFALDRAGLVGEDGPTHHGVFDIAYLRHLPNMSIVAPSDDVEMAGLFKTCVSHDGPVTIRYPRGTASLCASDLTDVKAIPLGKAKVIKEGKQATVLAAGPMLEIAKQAVLVLKKKGMDVTLIDPRSIKPLDGKLIKTWALKTKNVVTIEDHVIAGGFGSAVLEFLNQEKMNDINVLTLGYPDHFVEQGSKEELLKQYKLDAAGLVKTIGAFLAKQTKTKKTVKKTQ